MFNPEDYEEVTKKVKIIHGKDQKDTDGKFEVFAKDHNVIDVKQTVSTIMFVFYY